MNNLFDKIKIKLWKNTELARPVGWSTKQEIIKFDTMISILDEVAKEYATDTNVGSNGWIPCSERLPEEHETMFAKLKGTDKWDPAMFSKMSDDVNVTVEFDNGERKTMTLHTNDGKWNTNYRIANFKVIAWQPKPEPYQEGE